jgi:hypothetical protein
LNVDQQWNFRITIILLALDKKNRKKGNKGQDIALKQKISNVTGIEERISSV